MWHAAGSASLRNVTVSGNLAQGDGGGIYNSATLTLNNVTLTNNSVSGGDGGGLAGSFTTGTNTVIAANLDGALPNKPDCATTLNSGGYNLVQVTTGCTLIGNVATVISNTAPNLSGLGMFSGLTLTHLPLSNSPAIDAGNPATPNGVSPNCEILDQRGYARQSSRCDIGAVESDGLSQSVYLPLILR